MTVRSRLLLVGVVSFVIAATLTGGVVAGTADDGGAVNGSLQQADEPPTAAFTHSPENPEPGETIVLNASASSDPDGEIVNYRWDFDNDGQVDAEGGPNRRVAFPSAGTYTVRLTVVDNGSNTDTTTRDIEVVGDQPPEAVLNASATDVSPDETVSLDATASSDPDGRIVEWAFDTDADGEFEETFDSPATLQISYVEAGPHEVTLRVTDNNGLTSTASVTITVESAETTTTTGTAAGPATTAPGGQVGQPSAPGGGGALSSLDRYLPGGPLTAGLLIGLLLALVIVGGAVAYRRPDLAGPIGDAAQGPFGSFVLALVLVVLLVGLPIGALWASFAEAPSPGIGITTALVQLGALGLLVILGLLVAMERFTDARELEGELAEVVGPLTGDGFRTVVFGLAFLASSLLTVGVAGVLLARQQAYLADVSGGFLVGGISLVPLLLSFVFVLLWRQ